MKAILFMAIAVLAISCNTSNSENINPEDFLTPYEQGNGNQTATYDQTIAYYESLAAAFPTITLEEVGMTDAGKPLHLVHYSNNPIDWNSDQDDHIKIMINNGIHPGESDGIDATMMLMRDLAIGAFEVNDQIIFSSIAIYNVGGALNRNSDSRTNQNGPESYGFRGNARNYDLNRDFIKSDTRNSRAFATAFHKIKPDLFIDNHVSNGADYQYTLTHLFTQHNRLAGDAGVYVHEVLQPSLEDALKKRSLPITPYVNVFNQSPEEGFSQFVDYPRYSTGYTSLWNVLGMMVETHMLKPYKDRVYGTKAIMEEMIKIGSRDIDKIKAIRKANFKQSQTATHYAYNYKLDQTRADTLSFLGYESVKNKSDVTGNTLQTYDRSQPFEKKTAYYTYFEPQDSIVIPDFYVVPQGQWEVVELLKINQIEMQPIERDTIMDVVVYHIKDYSTPSSAYEGHYPHSNTVLEESEQTVNLRKNDWIVPTAQPGVKYIIETLEPAMADSFFKWNFFDSILQQKEGFSAYVFESTARELLKQRPELQKEFDSLKRSNESFASSNGAQLSWLHKRSPNYEDAHLRYPIFKSN